MRFPGLEEALESRAAELQARARVRATRRMFLGLGLGSVFGACAGGAVVGATSSSREVAEEPYTPDPALEPLRKLAIGPLDELLKQQARFVVDLGRAEPPAEDPIWVGFGRLASGVAEGNRRTLRGLRGLLLSMAKKPSFPKTMRGWVELLERHGR